MAVTTSKLKTSMPMASEIRWYAPTTKNRFKNTVTNENRRYTKKLCFKQPSSTNRNNVSWQIKYRFKCRYTPSAQKAGKKKAEWTNPSSWRTPYAGMYRGSNGKSKKYAAGAAIPDPKYWLKGNRPYAKNSTYNFFLDWYNNPKWMGADYDCIMFEFAVRSYKSGKHGNWVTQKLYVYRAATVANEVLIKQGGGGLHIDFNYICDRGDPSVSITSVVDAKGNDLLKNDVKVAPTTDTNRAASGDLDWYAYKRNGYTPGQVTISATNLTRKVEFDEKLKVTGHFITSANVKTAFSFRNEGTVYGKDALDQIPIPDITVTTDGRGIATVVARKNSKFDGSYGAKLTNVNCSATYTIDGETKNLSWATEDKVNLSKNGVPTGADAKLGTWTFRPPMGVEVEYYASISNELGQFKGAYKYETVECSGVMLNGITYPSIHASLTFNTSLSKSTNKEVAVNLPFGRDLPFAVFGKGRNSSMSLKGYVVDIPEEKQKNKYATPYHIKKLAENIGLYHMRTSNGEIFVVALKSVEWEYESVGDTNVMTVSMEMEEVSTD